MSVNPNLQIKNPLSYVKQTYNKRINARAFRFHFYQRNNVSVLTPFLKGIDAQFVIVDQQVFVKSSQEIINKLVDMGFVHIFEMLHDKQLSVKSDAEFKDLVCNSARLYHLEYNMEVYLINQTNWTAITAANTIITDLKPHDKLTTFVSVYNSLLKLSNIE